MVGRFLVTLHMVIVHFYGRGAAEENFRDFSKCTFENTHTALSPADPYLGVPASAMARM